jgi:hypothetical protein
MKAKAILPVTQLSSILAVEDGEIRPKDGAVLDEGTSISFKCDLGKVQFGVNPSKSNTKSLFPNSMNGGSLMELLTDHRTLLRQARWNYLLSYLSGAKHPSPLPLLGNNYYFEFLQWNQDRSRVCAINAMPDDLARFEQEKIRSANGIPEALQGWLSVQEYEKLVKEGLKKLEDSLIHSNVPESQMWVPNDWLKKIDELKGLLVSCAKEDRIQFVVGPAGTGKSSYVVNSLNSGRNVVVSLSNTIGLMFKKKCAARKVPVGIDNFSCTAAHWALYSEKTKRHWDIVDRDCVVIDEFSQWGLESVDLLTLLLKKNPNAYFYVMGDIDQIPTFLSSGSLLYSATEMLRKEFPHLVTEMRKQYRYAHSSKYMELVEAMTQENHVPDSTPIDTITDHYLKNCDCFITGANKHVATLNDRAFAAKFGLPLKRVETARMLSDKAMLAFSKDPNSRIELISTSTKIVETQGGSAKLLANERWMLTKTSGVKFPLFHLTSEVTGNEIAISRRDLDYSFTLGYAITVNKSQGLDWNKVGVVLDPYLDYNLQAFNALYVAATRGKDAMFFLQEPDKRLSVALLNKYLTSKIKFRNFFE